jgi:serine/threonine-protein kinase
MHRAQRIARLRHPNLVRMLPLPGGAGLAPLRNQGRCLADFTPAGTFKRFELESVLRLLLDVLSGLQALHDDIDDGEPFVHGQVSPEHIHIADDGTARLVPLVNRHFTADCQPRSTGYTAPEILLGDAGDPRSDVFSVGVMLWEALAGAPLFSEVSARAVLARLACGEVPALVPRVKQRWALKLCTVAERAIAVDPNARFQSAIELSNAIGAAAGRHLQARDDNWQDEAPTLLLDVGPELKSPRAITPPGTVVDLETAPSARGQRDSAVPEFRPGLRLPRFVHQHPGVSVAVVSASMAAAIALLVPLPELGAAGPSAAGLAGAPAALGRIVTNAAEPLGRSAASLAPAIALPVAAPPAPPPPLAPSPTVARAPAPLPSSAARNALAPGHERAAAAVSAHTALGGASSANSASTPAPSSPEPKADKPVKPRRSEPPPERRNVEYYGI